MTYLLLPRLNVHNANAMSSTFTIGVPAITAWLGAIHALERKIRREETLSNIRLPAVAVVFHKHHLYIDPVRRSIIGIGKPLNSKGERPSRMDEPRIDVVVSLLVEVHGVTGDNNDTFLQTVSSCLARLKMAGGDLLSFGKPKCFYVEAGDEQKSRKILAQLMPGYALVSRKELLEKEMAAGTDALDALLSFLSVHHTAVKNEDGKVDRWIASRKEPGWLIPISVGFKGISPLGHVAKQRGPDKLHRFAENVVSLGEFVMPYRAQEIESLLWKYRYDPEKSLYLCENHYASK